MKISYEFQLVSYFVPIQRSSFGAAVFPVAGDFRISSYEATG
ncbi:MAG: hypothetical protein ACMUIA_05035 [bacterium]